MILEVDQVSTEVVANYTVTLSYGGTTKDGPFTEAYGNTTDALFMTVYNSKELKVIVSDYRGNAIDGIASIKWDITHDATIMKEYGGYTGNSKGTNTVTLTLKDGSTTEYMAPAQEFRVAGKYTSAITVDMGINGTISLNAVPTFTVKSKHPTFAIDKISPSGSHKCINSSGSNVTVTSKIDGNTITIYPKSEKTGSGCNTKYTLQEEPKVYLKLTGLGNADNATLTFTSDQDTVRMYSGSSSKSGTQTPTYLWDSSTGESVMRFIGYNDGGSCDDSEPAGTLTSDTKVVLTYGTETYNVAISAITIINNQP